MENKRSAYFRRHFLIVAIASMFIVSAIGLFNIYVDYTGIFGLKDGVSKIKLRTDNRRIVMPGLINSYKPSCIITGTSRVGRSINPTYPIIAGKHCMNLFLNAGDAYEISKLLDYGIKVSEDLSTLYIGLDFFMFDEDLDVSAYQARFKEENYEYKSFVEKIYTNTNLVFSKDAFRENLNIFLQEDVDYATMQKLTFSDASLNKPNISRLDAIYGYAKQVWNVVRSGGHGYHDFNMSPRKITSLYRVLETYARKDIEIKIWMNPMHVYFMETLYQSELMDEYARIVSEFSKLTDYPNVTFYDFSGFNSVTANGYVGDKTCFPDAGHTSVEVGNAMLEIMNDNKVSPDFDFGVVLNNIDDYYYLNIMTEKRNQWAKHNKWDVEIVNKVIKCSQAEDDYSCVGNIVRNVFDRYSLRIEDNNVKIPSEKNQCITLKYKEEDSSPRNDLAERKTKTINPDIAKKIRENEERIQRAIALINEKQKMIKIPSGSFIMGEYPYAGLSNERPRQKIYLDEYYIDATEVTYEYFKMLDMAPIYDYHYEENMPVAGVTWEQAHTYCEKLGKRLPTEAEWEKAARGIQGNRYPWGNEWPTCDEAVFNGDEGSGCGLEKPWNVGSKEMGKSPYGVYDMAGNVYEFTFDSYDPGFYKTMSYKNPVNNELSSAKVIRGGGWSSEYQDLRVTRRRPVDRNYAAKNIGFRCAKTGK